MTGDRPYADTHQSYLDAGWPSVIPILGKAGNIPQGFTGLQGRYPDQGHHREWVRTRGGDNLAVRLSRGPETTGDGIIHGDHPALIGIDVDAYNGKRGDETLTALEALHGALPATFRSTARGKDNPSGIRFYRVPAGLFFPGELAAPDPDTGEKLSDIEVIQAHHRYAIVWPSIHPDGGTYQWFDDTDDYDNDPLDSPPAVDDLPWLPDTWVQALQSDPPDVTDPDAQPDWGLRDGEVLDGQVAATLTRALEHLQAPAGSRHATMLGDVMHLVRWEQAGADGATTALKTLAQEYVTAVSGSREGGPKQAFGEVLRAVANGRQKAATGPPPAGLSYWTPDNMAKAFAIPIVPPAASQTAAAPSLLEAPAPADRMSIDAGEWEDPVAYDTVDDTIYPPFPLDCLPNWMADAVVDVAAALQVPIDFTGPLAIGALSAATVGRLNVSIDGVQNNPCNLWVGVGAEPTSGKTPALKALVSGPLDRLEANLADRWKIDQRRYKQRLKDLEKSTDPGEQMEAERIRSWIGPRPMLTGRDMTPEALVNRLATQQRGVAIVDDEGAILSSVDRYRTAGAHEKLEPWLVGYSGAKYVVDRIKEDGSYAVLERHMNVAAVITAQPLVLRAVFGTGETAVAYRRRGFTARWLVVVPDSWVGTRKRSARPAMGPATTKTYADTLEHLARTMFEHARGSTPDAHNINSDRRLTLTFDTQARTAFGVYGDRLESELGPDGRLRVNRSEVDGWKAEDHVQRIAGLLALADAFPATSPFVLPTAVTIGHVARAIRLTDYFMAQYLGLAGRLEASAPTGPAHALARRVDKLIDGGTIDGPVTRRWLQNRLRINSDDVGALIDSLLERGWIQVDRHFLRGQSQTLTVHPRWLASEIRP